MNVSGHYNADAVNYFFAERADDKALFGNKKSRYTRLVLEKDANGKERLSCRTLKWQERVLAKLNLGNFATRLGYGNANLRDIIKRCPDLYIYDTRLLKLIKSFNKSHTFKKIPGNYRLLLNLPALRPKNHFDACKSGDLRRLEYLVQKGEDIQAKNAEGKTLLHLACQHSQPEIADCILKNGGDVNARNTQGKTALIEVCSNFFSRGAIVNILLAHPNIDYTITDNEGKNALQYALIQGNYSLFLLLLDKGVPASLLGDVVSQNVIEQLCFFKRIDVLEKLHEIGVDLAPKSIKAQHLNTALFLGHYDVAKFFLSLMQIDQIEDSMTQIQIDVPPSFYEKGIEQFVVLVATGAKKKNLEFEAYLDTLVPSKIPEACKRDILDHFQKSI